MPNLAITNNTSGEVSPTMEGRPDVGRYANACRVLENFLLTTTGMTSFRPGFRLMGLPKAGETPMLRRFRAGGELGESYMLELGHKYGRVWHTSGQVATTGTPVEFTTLFENEDHASLSFTQSVDFLFVTHETRGIFAIKRSSHTSWVCDPFPLTDGPYARENIDAGKTLALSGTSGSVTVTAAGHAPFGDGDGSTIGLGRHIRINDGGWKWLRIDAYTSPTQVTATVMGAAFATGGPFSAWRLGIYSSRIGFPAAAILHEQRLVLGGAASARDRVDGSRIGSYETFSPGSDANEAWAYTIGTKDVNRILAFGSSNDLIAFTVGGEHRIAGDSTGAAITPSAIFTKPISPSGAKRIEPRDAVGGLLFVDQLGLNLRSLGFNLAAQNYSDENLSLLSDHMCFLSEDSPGFTDLAYQANPFGTAWLIRGNAELAGCLHAPAEQVLGFHRHPLGMPVEAAAGESAMVESIDTMKGPTHEELWAVVRRELPSGTLRTIERMDRPGLWDAPPESLLHLDCGLSLRNTPAATLTPSAVSGNAVTLTLSDATDGFGWQASDATNGRLVKRRWLSGYTKRKRPIWKTAIARITGVSSATVATAKVLAPFRNTAAIPAGQWGLTVSRLTGLDHFEGLAIVAVSDGRVCKPRVVVGGGLDLDTPGWEVHAGLKYAGWMITLPLDPGPSPAVGMGRMQRIDKIMARVLNTIGGKFGAMPETDEEQIQFDSLYPYNQGQAAPSAAPPAFSGDKVLSPAGAWSRRAELAIHQDEPLPCNVQLVVVHDYSPWVQP